jgi:hypothetical protein
MAGHRCPVVALCLIVCLAYASARKLHQHSAESSLVADSSAALTKQQPSSDLLAANPVLVGDGAERIIRSQSVRQRGGAMRAIGRNHLKTLRAKSGFQGTLVDLAQHIETDSDLVSGLRLRPGAWWIVESSPLCPAAATVSARRQQQPWAASRAPNALSMQTNTQKRVAWPYLPHPVNSGITHLLSTERGTGLS